MNYKSIAIDGPAAAGKSTLAKALAAELNFLYVNTGAIYRAVAMAAQRAGYSDADDINEFLKTVNISIKVNGNAQKTILDGEDVSEKLRTPELSMLSSKLSALPEVRAFLLEMQRKVARQNNVVMEGRDIGTVVLPEATLKIFLAADPNARATRRLKDCEVQHIATNYESVLRDLQKRDHDDSTREEAPLKQAEDAIRVDNSSLTVEQTVAVVKCLFEKC